MKSILTFTKILVNLTKVLLIGSLGFIVFSFILGAILMCKEVSKEEDKKLEIQKEYCIKNPGRAMCKTQP